MLEGHPLRKLFADLTRETFYRELHHYDSEVAAYLVDLLVGFARVEDLYKIRDAAGRRLEDVGEMLIESNPLLGAASSAASERSVSTSATIRCFSRGSFPSTSSGRGARSASITLWTT